MPEKEKTMPKNKLETLGSLQRLNDALAAKAEETQELAASRATFDAKVTLIHGLVQQQATLTADKQEVTRQFQEALIEAQRQATVLRAALRFHYGPDSERLVEFGLQPFRGKRRKPSPPEPSPVEATAEP
jgi:hypothetical protein